MFYPRQRDLPTSKNAVEMQMHELAGMQQEIIDSIAQLRLFIESTYNQPTITRYHFEIAQLNRIHVAIERLIKDADKSLQSSQFSKDEVAGVSKIAGNQLAQTRLFFKVLSWNREKPQQNMIANVKRPGRIGSF